MVSSLVCTFTLFRNAVSQVELHVVAPEWLHVAIIVKQHLHCGHYVVCIRVRRVRGIGKEKIQNYSNETIPRENTFQV